MDVRRTAAFAAGMIVLLELPGVAAPFVAGEPRPLCERIAAANAAVIVRKEDPSDR